MRVCETVYIYTQTYATLAGSDESANIASKPSRYWAESAVGVTRGGTQAHHVSNTLATH